MQKIYYIALIVTLIFTSCGSSSKKRAVISSKKAVSQKTIAKRKTPNKTNTYSTKKSTVTTASKKSSKSNSTIASVINHAKSFSGTKYKYGGTTKSGMDCSGLVYTSFKKENIILPRTSRTMATQGKAIALKKVEIGDLLFFKTSKKNIISHVGLVVETKGGIKFIHSSSSRGVIISSLSEKYWNNAYASARRIL